MIMFISISIYIQIICLLSAVLHFKYLHNAIMAKCYFLFVCYFSIFVSYSKDVFSSGQENKTGFDEFKCLCI